MNISRCQSVIDAVVDWRARRLATSPDYVNCAQWGHLISFTHSSPRWARTECTEGKEPINSHHALGASHGPIVHYSHHMFTCSQVNKQIISHWFLLTLKRIIFLFSLKVSFIWYLINLLLRLKETVWGDESVTDTIALSTIVLQHNGEITLIITVHVLLSLTSHTNNQHSRI